MPIVVRPGEGEPLAQGDILRGVVFAVTNEAGNLAADKKALFALVVSRPCKALRDDVVVVAPVVPYPVDLSEVSRDQPGRLEKMRRFLAGLRDGIKGGDFSDALYLGPLDDGSPKRYAAQLTTLATVLVPTEQASRRDWIRERRVWKLDVEFLRDLHTRLLLTFTRLGFDDHQWFTDADLDVMITAGKGELAHLQGELAAAEQAVQAKEAAGSAVQPQQLAEIAKKKRAVEETEEQLQPYLEEQRRTRHTELAALAGRRFDLAEGECPTRPAALAERAGDADPAER
jgi:hypothetical protein